MKQLDVLNDNQINDIRQKFDKAMILAYQLLGDYAFR